MRRIAVTFGMVAAITLANPARAALQLPHDFFNERAPPAPPVYFDMIGNLPNGFGVKTNGGQFAPFAGPVAPSFQSGIHDNGLELGGNGVPLFNVRFDPGHDFYNTLTAQIAVPSVPEPQTWMMLLLGFAATGFAMRRARLRKAPPARQSLDPASFS